MTEHYVIEREKLRGEGDPVLPALRVAYPELGFLFDEIDDARRLNGVNVDWLQDEVDDLSSENMRARATLREAKARFRQIAKVTTEYVIRTLAEEAEAYIEDAC